MDPTFEQAISCWNGFYTFIGAESAALLIYAGLLTAGVAISRDASRALLRLAILSLVLLTLAVLSAWTLLSHAAPG